MLTKYNKFKVLSIFFDSPETKFHIREIARLTKISPPGVMNIVKFLVSEDLLRTEKNGFVKNVFPATNEKFINLKRLYNIFFLQESGIVNFLAKEYENPDAIVLFGSYSKGEDVSRSDIDLAVVTKKHMSVDVKKFEVLLKRKINLQEVRHPEKEFLNTLANGTVLYGYLEVIK